MPKTDRDLHDEVIRYLSDANLRSIETVNDFLEEPEAERAQRFSRFLARRYYRDRLTRGFRYAAQFGAKRTIEQMVDSSEFDRLLDRCILGSLLTSKEVGELALSQLLNLRGDVWWNALLEYERAFFLQLATSETTPAGMYPQRNASAVMREFHISIPELFAQMRSGAEINVSTGGTTLLFSRTVHGRIYVVELDERTSSVFQAIDGKKSPAKLAACCRVPHEEIQRILATLSDIGSIVLPID